MTKPSHFIIAGLVLVVLALGLAFFAFYNYRVLPELSLRNNGELEQFNEQKELSELELAKLKSEVVPEGSVTYRSLKRYSMDLYGKDERVRSEGTFWCDKNQKCLVNLGSLNGLDVGQNLVVFEGESQLGEVKAVEVFDVVSLVDVSDFSSRKNQKYYSVKIQ